VRDERFALGNGGSGVSGCDALVFFGASGDLAYKQILPALAALVKRGDLRVPVIGVARAGWTVGQVVERARHSLEDRGTLDEASFAHFASLLRFVDGDYGDPATFARLREELGAAKEGTRVSDNPNENTTDDARIRELMLMNLFAVFNERDPERRLNAIAASVGLRRNIGCFLVFSSTMNAIVPQPRPPRPSRHGNRQ
jgi:Glucose-6-phosphate dehydrogenase, NAD binding domain